jgi:predicted P-loop ATPase
MEALATGTATPLHALPAPRSPARPALAKLCDVLEDDALLARLGYGPLRFDLLRWAPCAGDELLGAELADTLCAKLATADTDARLPSLSPDLMRRALALVARQRSFHPIADALRGLTWDNQPRLEKVASEILRVQGGLPSRLVRRWIILAAARALEPGVAADGMLVLAGCGHAVAARFFQTLLGTEWVLDTPARLGSRALDEQLRSAWVCLWPDFASFARVGTANAFAAFSARCSDFVRDPFAWRDEVAGRTTVFASSAEAFPGVPDGPLRSRCWTVPVGRIDFAKLAGWREQLWAEACAAVDRGEALTLDDADREALPGLQEMLTPPDPWEEPVLKRMAETPQATMEDLLVRLFYLSPRKVTMAHQHRLGRILRRNGFESQRLTIGGRQVTVWARPAQPHGGR